MKKNDERDFLYLNSNRYFVVKLSDAVKIAYTTAMAIDLPSIGKLTSLVAILISLHFLFIDFRSKTILIDEISASKAVQDMGFTSQTLASMLKDGIQHNIRGFHSSQEGPSAILPNELPSVTLAGTGLSVDVIASFLQSFFGYNRRLTVSGSVISETAGCKLLLWANGQLILELSSGSDVSSINGMMTSAANAVLASSSPYYDALITYNSDRDHTVAKIDRILVGLDETDENVPWLVSLKAISLMNDGKINIALDYLKSYLKDKHDVPVIHQDLAIMFRNLNNYSDAATEIYKAIEEDGANPRLHGYAGEILSEAYDDNNNLSTLSAAVNELKFALNHDRSEVEYQYELAIALLKLSRTNEGKDFMAACKQLESAQAIDDPERRYTALTYIQSRFIEINNCIKIQLP